MPEPSVHFAACNLCDAMCGLRVTIQHNQIVDLRGDPDDVHSHGHLCSKAHALRELRDDPDRVRQPQQRTGDQWHPLDWSEAYDLAAERIRTLQHQHGPDAVALYVGNPVAHSHRAALGAQALTMALGSKNRFDANSQDSNPRLFACMAAYGDALAMPVPDVDNTSYLLMIGANPAASNGSMMGLGDTKKRLAAVRQRSGKLVIVDPRQTETAAWCDEHVFIRPGGDAALLLAMLHVISTEGLADRKFLATYARGASQLFRIAHRFGPHVVAERIGVDASTIVRLALELAAAPSAGVHVRVGVCQNEFAPLANYLAEALVAVTGNLGRRGGMLFAQPAADIAPIGRLAIGNHVGRWKSRVRGLPEFLGSLPSAALAEEIATPGKGQIRGLVTMAGNPVLSVPGGPRLAEQLSKLDFFAAIDIYVGATSRLAHLILPPRHVFETKRFDLLLNRFGVRQTARFDQPFLTAAADAPDDWQIALELALRLRLPRFLHGVARLALRNFPEQLVDLLLRTGAHSLRLAELAQQPHGVDLGPLPTGLAPHIRFADGRVDLASDLVLGDCDRLSEWLKTPVPALALIGRRHLRDCNSWLHNLSSTAKGPERAALFVHPHDAQRLGLHDCAIAQVSNKFGQLTAPVTVTDRMMVGVVSLPHGYGHQSAAATLRLAGSKTGANVNTLTDPSLVEPLVGQSILNGVPVRVEAVDARHTP